MNRWIIIGYLILFSSISFAGSKECGAFFYKVGVAADFPIKNKRDVWLWHKKVRPEYVWMVEMGYYKNGNFIGNGFGFAINIGTYDLQKNHTKQGTLEDLVRYSAKNAFLTKESKFYFDEEIKESVQFKTLVDAKVIDDVSIAIMVIDPKAVKMAKMGNPTHMKLSAILPEEKESYTCFPEIEVVE